LDHIAAIPADTRPRPRFIRRSWPEQGQHFRREFSCFAMDGDVRHEIPLKADWCETQTSA
jgi:hypothetical protein